MNSKGIPDEVPKCLFAIASFPNVDRRNIKTNLQFLLN